MKSFFSLESKVALDLAKKPTGVELSSKLEGINELDLEKSIDDFEKYLVCLVNQQLLTTDILVEAIQSIYIDENKLKKTPGKFESIRIFLTWLRDFLDQIEMGIIKVGKSKSPVDQLIMLFQKDKLYKKYYAANRIYATKPKDTTDPINIDLRLHQAELKLPFFIKPALLNKELVSVLVKNCINLARLLTAAPLLAEYRDTCREVHEILHHKKFTNLEVRDRLNEKLHLIRLKVDINEAKKIYQPPEKTSHAR